jgi:pilus assembly protein CpaF
MKHEEQLQERILEELDLSKEVGDEELMELIHRVLEESGEQCYIPLKEKVSLGKELFNAFRKLDILQELIEDDEITEIMINGTENIFIEKDGRLRQLQKRFGNRNKLEDIIQQIVAGANRMVNEASPIVDARLEDGSRVNVVLYPVALNGPVVTIRKFPKEAMTMQELIRRQSISQEVDEVIKKLVVAKYNIFISGGTGSG